MELGSLKGKHLISLADLTPEAMRLVLNTTMQLKIQQRTGQSHPILAGKTLGMIFERESTRTRISFEVGMLQLGGHALFLPSKQMQLGRGEPISDTIRVLSRYVDGVMARVYDHRTLEEMAGFGTIPIINGLSNREHPCQALGDLFTILEKKGKLAGVTMAYFGDGHNVCHSLLLAGAMAGMRVHSAHPAAYLPDPEVVEKARALAARSGGEVMVGTDPVAAARGADVLYTDVWLSPDQEGSMEERLAAFMPCQVNSTLLAHADPDAIVMHCLPAHRDEEITDQVMEGPHSVVFDQAENRLHAQKAVMALLMG